MDTKNRLNALSALVRFAILLVGLFYAGYLNGLLKETISPINRLVLIVVFIWGLYSGIRELERRILAYMGHGRR